MRRTPTLDRCLVPVLAPLLSSSPARAAEQPPLAPGTIITVAGAGRPGFSGDGGPTTNARLNNLLGPAIDGAGNRFIGDARNARVRRVRPHAQT